MDFRVLGPLEAVAEGQVVALEAAKPRALLAILLLHANEPVATDRLIENLWAGRPPATAAKVLQTYVSQLRKALAADAIVTGPAGYALRVDPGRVDLHRFEALLTDAREAEPAGAAALLREALALWRGPPLADFAYAPWAQGEIGRLAELHLSAVEDRIDADLALGRHGELVGELERLVVEHPLSERMRGQLMLALYRSGRQVEALEAYRSARETLVETLGIEPGSALRRLERAILTHDPELDVAVPPPEIGPAPSLRPRSTSFVGRRRELRELRALLSQVDVRLLTLTGAGGTGKTRLAVEAAAGLGDAFPDGVVLVELAPIVDADLVAAAMVDTFGLAQLPGSDSAEVLVAYLRARRALLVLDNFEHVLEAAPLLANLVVGAPGVTFLVTSRVPLDISDERIYAVKALELPDTSRPFELGRLRRTEAVRLFAARARDARPDFELSESNADSVGELCVRLDGLPLALELAAARIKLLAPGDILVRLGQRLEFLKAEPGAGVPERHRTLRAAIEWSYDLLTEDEQSLFTSLAVFVGGFTLEGAEAIAGDIDVDVLDGVESLLNNNLLRTERIAGGEPRFGMLETIREYALERLAERGDGEAVQRRHANFYVLLAEKADPGLFGPQQLSWLERLDAEFANICGALTWSAESAEAEAGLRIGSALWRYWQLRGSNREGRERLELLLSSRAGSNAARAKAQWVVASLASPQGDHETVCRLVEASLPVHRALGDDVVVAISLGLLGLSVLAQGDVKRARALTEEGLEIARGTRDLSTEAMLLANVGVVLAATGNLDEAEHALEESVDAARRLGNLRSVGNWLRALGSISLARHDYARAQLRFEESLAVGRTLGDRWEIAHSLSNLALVALEERDENAAHAMLAESTAIERESGDRLGLAGNLEMFARLAVAQGRPARACRLEACAGVLRESVGFDAFEVGWPDPAANVGHLRAVLGDDALAEAWEQGCAMTLDESLGYALAQDRT